MSEVAGVFFILWALFGGAAVNIPIMILYGTELKRMPWWYAILWWFWAAGTSWGFGYMLGGMA